MKIFTGTKSVDFAKNICEHLDVKLSPSRRQDFSDGEFTTHIEETVRGQIVYLVQSTFQPSDNLFELLMMADACKRAGASKIVAVVPYFGYARQDKKDAPRVPITASLIARFMEDAGVDHLVTMDLHADQIQGFFRIPVSHIYSSAVMVPFLKKIMNGKNLIMASPDMGGTKRAKSYSKFFDTDMVVCYKHRTEANKIAEMMLVGDVKGKDVLLIDDLIDTAGTICKAADMMLAKGALSVSAVVTHPVLSGDAFGHLGRSGIDKLYVTDSISIENSDVVGGTEEFINDTNIGRSKVEVISTASLFGDIIKNIENNQSISVNFL